MDFGQYLKYGVEVAVIGALFVIVWRILVWVMAFVRETTIQHNEERKTWLAVINSLKSAIEAHIQSSIASREATQEAHKYQREEHLKMLENQTKFIEKEATVCKCLEEVREGLGRINGYKHES